ncbi:hypothetical protein EJB05_33826, partial [Eragrostis curvula]
SLADKFDALCVPIDEASTKQPKEARTNALEISTPGLNPLEHWELHLTVHSFAVKRLPQSTKIQEQAEKERNEFKEEMLSLMAKQREELLQQTNQVMNIPHEVAETPTQLKVVCGQGMTMTMPLEWSALSHAWHDEVKQDYNVDTVRVGPF